MKMVDGAVPRADSEALPDRLRDKFLCQHNRILDIFSFGEISGNGRGKSAACTVGVARANARRT